eukprot:1138727-Pelagomonas_calceolata.AAC.2
MHGLKDEELQKERQAKWKKNAHNILCSVYKIQEAARSDFLSSKQAAKQIKAGATSWLMLVQSNDVEEHSLMTASASNEVPEEMPGLLAQSKVKQIVEEYKDAFEPAFPATPVYLDDILVMYRTPEEHEQHLRIVSELLRKYELKGKLSKCELNKPELHFWGHVVGKEGISVDPAKIAVIEKWPLLKCLKEFQAFLGLANYFRKFV